MSRILVLRRRKDQEIIIEVQNRPLPRKDFVDLIVEGAHIHVEMAIIVIIIIEDIRRVRIVLTIRLTVRLDLGEVVLGSDEIYVVLIQCLDMTFVGARIMVVISF
jgi:hypothetical protein